MSVTRKIIRNTVTDLLKAIAGVDAENVRASRIRPNPKDELPAINIYTTGESISDNGESPLLNKRLLNVVCEVLTSSAEDDNFAVNEGDDIAQRIEDILFKEDADTKGKLGCLISEVRLQSIALDIEGPGESAINAVRLAFGITYYAEAVTDEANNTNSLDRLGVDWDVGTASDPDPEAKDIIEVGP